MLEFYRNHYMTKNLYINLLDIVIAVFFTMLLWNASFSFVLKVIIIALFWLKALLTVVCMIQYRGEKS